MGSFRDILELKSVKEQRNMQETMTGRQRVMAAINHQPVDRMPIDLGVHFSTGISAFAYRNLRDYLGLSTDQIEVADPVQMLARVDEDILQRFHCDAILLNPPSRKRHVWQVRDQYAFWIGEHIRPVRNDSQDWLVTNGNSKMRMPAGGYFFDGDWINPGEYADENERLKAYAARAEYIYKETGYFTLQMGFSGYFGGMDFACDILTDPKDIIRRQEADLTRNLARITQVIRTYGPYIQAIEVNSDLGLQNSPYLSPENYERYCQPYLQRFCRFVHDNSDIKIFLHSCGAIAPLIPCIIEAGVDILNPVQISAAGMDPKLLKERFGQKICFWGGGCDTQNVLPWATPEEVSRHVKSTIGIFKPGSGFVFNQVHNIMGNIRPENIVAMLDTAWEISF